jgi:hypothetical protein
VDAKVENKRVVSVSMAAKVVAPDSRYPSLFGHIGLFERFAVTFFMLETKE